MMVIWSWRLGASVAAMLLLAAYITWLYWVTHKEHQDDAKRITQLEGDVDYLLAQLDHDEEPPTEELPVVVQGPPTSPAHPVDTFARQEAVLSRSRHRVEGGGRSVNDILVDAGQEPLK